MKFIVPLTLCLFLAFGCLAQNTDSVTNWFAHQIINTNQIDANTWNAATNLPAMASNVRSGRTAVTSLLTSTNITFTSPMASTNYQIFQGTISGNLAVFGVPSNITTSGFTMNFTVGITSTIGYICILNQ